MVSLQERYEPIARDAARAVGIDPDLFVRQISQESGWADDVIDCRRSSSAGAMGIAQIVGRFHPHVNPCDPVAALNYAANLMRNHLAVRDGDWALALSMYNAGPGATASGLAGTLPGWPYDETVRYVSNILGISQESARSRLTGGAPVPVRFDPTTPPIRQNDDFSCAPTSARWVMTALGRQPTEQWFESTMLAESVVTREHGLMDASGAGLAAFLRRHYGEFGYDAAHTSLVGFDDVARVAGQFGVLIGGRAWGGVGHWVGVSGYDAGRDMLLIANPSPGFGGVGDELTRSQFQNVGPFSLVMVTHPDLTATPEPPAPVDETAALREQINGLLIAVAHLADVVVPKAVAAAAEREAALEEAQRIRVQFVGEKPA